MLTGVKVRRVLIRDGRAAGVQARGLTVRAPIVVVACGALLTPGLLRRSGVRSPALGRHLTIHPASAARARFDEPIDPWDGVPQSYYVDALADEGIMLEGIAGPPDQAALATPGTGARAPRADARRAQHRLVRRDGGRQRDGLRARGRRAAARALRPAPRRRRAPAPRLRAAGRDLVGGRGARDPRPAGRRAGAARRRQRPAGARARAPARRQGDGLPSARHRARRRRPGPRGGRPRPAGPRRRRPLRRRRQRGAVLAAGQPAGDDHGAGGAPGARAGGRARRRLCQDGRA